MPRLTVSTVIPAYRAARTIARALDSVLGQTRPPDEILVIDDGSPDDLEAALSPYQGRVRLVRKANGGAASARNLGIDLARSDLIAFLDADDYWEPHKLARQVELFRTHPGLGVASSRWFIQVPNNPRTPRLLDPGEDFDRLLTAAGSRAFSVATKMWTSTIVVRRDVIGSLRFASGIEPIEDRDMWVRLVLRAPVFLSSEPLATYVLEPGSLTRCDQVDRDYGNMIRVVDRHRDILGHTGVRQWEAAAFRGWAAQYLGSGRPRAAWWPAWRRLVRQPLSIEGWWVLLKSSLTACLPQTR